MLQYGVQWILASHQQHYGKTDTVGHVCKCMHDLTAYRDRQVLFTILHCPWQVLTAILPLIVAASVIGEQFEAGTNSTVCHPLPLSAHMLHTLCSETSFILSAQPCPALPAAWFAQSQLLPVPWLACLLPGDMAVHAGPQDVCCGQSDGHRGLHVHPHRGSLLFRLSLERPVCQRRARA